MSTTTKSIPKSIRFSEEELRRIQNALVKKISIEGRTCTFSEFVVEAVIEEVAKIEKVRVKNMKDLTVNAYYQRDISSYKDIVVTRLKKLYPQASVEVGGDLVSFKIKTDQGLEGLANEVQGELNKIIKH